MRKTDLVFWTLLTMTGLAGATTVFNVTQTYSANSPNSELYRQLDLFGDVFERVRSDYVEKPDDTMLVESAINGMLAALDPHSSYMSPKNYRDMQVQTRGEFGGLGIEVTMENGVVKVVSPIDETPASKAGVQANDLITHLDNEQISGHAHHRPQGQGRALRRQDRARLHPHQRGQGAQGRRRHRLR
jgi:carboxyl-terminal processing protease